MIGFNAFTSARRVRAWTLTLTGAGAILGWTLGQWLPDLQWPLAALLIGLIGIQHGALDHILHAHMHGDPEGPLRQSFVLPYIAGMGVAWAAFEWAPSVMLGLFLIVSAYHFGMSHLRVDAMRQQRPPTSAKALAGTLIGMALIAPLVLRPDALAILSEYGWAFDLRGQAQWLPLQVATGCAAFLTAVLHQEVKSGLLPLAGALLAWMVPDLLLAFALYFVLGHSREAFLDEFKNRQSMAVRFSSLYLRSLPLSITFGIMAAGVFWLTATEVLSERSALSFLLAGTLPHIAVIENWVTARTR
jgi:Brp/Blh family beta-carotene 15,15'-monooxygenase